MKRLVICCDGTWSTLANTHPTNVALMAQTVAQRDADGNPQIVYYDDGVGVEVGRMDMFSAAFGNGLDYKIQEAYEFLTFNYEPGDQLYFFGYSRGAYTVRSLAGLVRKAGILQRRHAAQTKAAMELYRSDIHPSDREAEDFRLAFAAAWPKLDATGMHAVMGGMSYDLRVRYLGVWDTVGSLGIPRKMPFAQSVNKKYEFHDLDLSRSVLSARQAVAIDERRGPFAPSLWSNPEQFNIPGVPPRVEQVWFAGDHGCVGGGNPAVGLSSCALIWIAEGAEAAGLAMDRSDGMPLALAEKDVNPVDCPFNKSSFDPMALFGSAWRQGLSNFDDVHISARRRWAGRSNYRPKPLKPFDRDLKAWRESNP